MFEILLFLFENYMENTAHLKMDDASIAMELENMGFNRHDIYRALHWIDGLIEVQSSITEQPLKRTKSMRYYLPEESEQLGLSGKELLLYLERVGVLDTMTREIVIDRVMALRFDEVTLGRIKWIVLMALFNQPTKKAALSLMQDIVFADSCEVLH